MSYDPRQHGALCDSCPLQGCRVVAPETSHRATIAIVGEAPGEQEEKIGRPFVGPSGMELDRAIRMAGASRGDFHITNALCCRPPDNDLKKLLSKISRANKAELTAAKEEEREPNLIMSPIECCAPRLEGELARFNNFITLGSTGTNAVTKHHDSILAIRGGLKELSRKTAGAVAAFAEAEPQAKQLTTKDWNEAFGDWQVKNGYSIRVMPTLHPAFILRQQRWAHVFRNDIFKAMKHFRGETGWVVPKATYNPDPHTLQKFLSDPNRVYTFDIETDGIESLTAHIRCIAIGDSEEVMVVGFRSNTRPRDQEGLFLDFYTVLEGFVIGGILVDFFTNKDIIKVGHNAGMYDRLVLRSQMHIDPTPVFDTILLHRNVESELPHSLAYVASLYTDAPSWKCYDSETEVLTPQGWVQFPLLPHGVEVAQWDKGAVSFVKPQAYVDQPYTGKMWQLKDQATDLLVTPDHGMIYLPVHNPKTCRPAHKGKLKQCKVQDLPKTGYLPHVGELFEGHPVPDAFVQFVAAVQADGSWQSPERLRFGFKKERKIQRLRGILTALGVPFRERKSAQGAHEFFTEPHATVDEVRKLLGAEKRFGSWLLDWSLTARRLFLAELLLWDGTKGEQHANYNTTEESNADWVQAVAVLSGQAARKYENINGDLPIYRVSLPGGRTRCRAWSKLESLSRTEADYNGRVYCVSVPAGFLVVRRGSNVTIAKNTDRDGNKLALGGESDQELAEYCLFEGTPVVLADGSTKPIEWLVRHRYAGEVLSLSASGSIEPKKVIGWHYTIAKEVPDWRCITFEGQRQKERGLVVTHDHQIGTTNGWKEAQHIQPGECIYYSEPCLNVHEQAAVIGTLLGDSSLVASPALRTGGILAARTLALEGRHSSVSGLAQWKERELWFIVCGPEIPGGPVKINGRVGEGGPSTPYCSRNLRGLTDVARVVYDAEGRRRLTREALQHGPRAWAWWYADDGCKQKMPGKRQETMVFSTQGFPREDVEQAKDYFCSTYGPSWVGKDNVLRLGKRASIEVAKAIAPYLPQEARYKLPYIEGVDWNTVSYEPVPSSQNEASVRKVISVTSYVPAAKGTDESRRTRGYVSRRRYCLDIDGNHNFFTSYGLVHNCLKDVAITARCFTPLLEQVRLRDQVEVWKSDQKMQLICADMHMVGMYVDQKKRMAEEKKLLKLRHELLEKIRSGLEKPKFNPASVYQMRDVLFKEWGLESHLGAADLREEDLETSSGDLSTGDLILRTLLTLRTVDESKRDIIKLIRRYRKCMKILGTYVVKLRPWDMGADLGWDEDDDWVTSEMRKKYGEEKRGIVDPRTGRMHPGYNMHVAVTGRLSSSKPLNAQNFPVSQRSMIVAQPGNVLVGADMDQLELRIAAALWEVELYLRAFREGKDPHSMTAYAVFGDAFCKAAGMSAQAFYEPGVLVGACFDEHGVFQKGVNKDAKSMRDLSKAVQYASVSSEVKVTLLDSRRAVPICEVSRGDWTWAWSTKNLRYEPARVKHVWPHGEKECVRVTFSWNASKNGGTQTDSVIVTADHPMLMRNGVLRHAGSLSAGDRLMPFYRDDAEDGYSYLNPSNDGVRVGEHRVVKGFYAAGERRKHVHHKNGKRRDNRPSNLEVLDHLDHYQEHKETIDAGRVNSPAWRAAVANPETRSAASSKAWEGRRERQDTDRTFGPRGSVLDTVKDQIGVKTDAEVAAMVGCTQELVGMYRKANSIAPPVGQKGWLRWLLTNDVLWNRLLHDNTDVEMARLVNEHFDVEATRDGVAKTRKLLGIPAVKKGRAEVYPRRESKLDAFADRVGHEKDAVIAAEAGCTAEAVGMYRKKHGIPLYWKEAPGGNNHTVVSIEPVGVREVWDIEVEHEDHNFALEAGIFVHNSQYMASVETVHQLIQKTELPATDPNTGKPLDDGTTDLPYAKLPLKRVREMRDAWLKGAPEFEQGWEKEIGEFREQGYLRDPVAGRRRDFLDGEEPNQIVNLKIQAAAAGLMNKALIAIAEEVPGHKWGPGTGVINQCHDSIAIECPESEAEKVVKLMEDRMNQEHPALRGVKFSATAVIGSSWKDV